MTDRKLLEDAAKAAGDAIDHWIEDAAGVPVARLESGQYWQPLHTNTITDCMGDALRLAVKLKIDYLMYMNLHDDLIDMYKSDHYAATRRAIVRAAAEIGRK